MSKETLTNVRNELIEIIDRLDSLMDSNTLSDKENVDVLKGRDYIYLGFVQIKNCLKDMEEGDL